MRHHGVDDVLVEFRLLLCELDPESQVGLQRQLIEPEWAICLLRADDGEDFFFRSPQEVV